MPTYKNISNNPINLNIGLTTKRLEPNETISTYYILDNVEGLERISDEPYYNPVLQTEDLTFSSSGDVKTVEILDNETPTVIRITNVTVDLDVYFNSESNTPAFPILAGDSITINNPKMIDKLIIYPKAAGQCKIIILRKL
jgi:hypothetical protein